MRKLTVAIFTTIVLLLTTFSPVAKAETILILITYCGVPLYVFAVTDIDGHSTANWAKYKELMANKEAADFLHRLVNDPNLEMKKWRVEQEIGATCI